MSAREVKNAIPPIIWTTCSEFDVCKPLPSCAKDDEGTTPEDTPVSLPVLSNGVDGVGDGLDTVELVEPEHGIHQLLNDELVYTLEIGYNRPDDFEYSVIDGNVFLLDANA